MADFIVAISPLVNHLFPDGELRVGNDCEAAVWDILLRVKGSRQVISSGEAIDSIQSIRQYAISHRLQEAELSCVGLLAHKILTSKIHSEVRSDKHLENLLRCLLPKDGYKNAERMVAQLLSDSETKRCTRVVLNLAHLVVLRYHSLQSSPLWWRVLPTYVFSDHLEAVRVLWFTTSIPDFRKRQFRNHLLRLDPKSASYKSLLDLLDRFEGKESEPDWLGFPNSPWEMDFCERQHKRIKYSTTVNILNPPTINMTTKTASEILSLSSLQHRSCFEGGNVFHGLSYKLTEQWYHGDRNKLLDALVDFYENTGSLPDVVAAFAAAHMSDHLLDAKQYAIIGWTVGPKDIEKLFELLGASFHFETNAVQYKIVTEILTKILYRLDSAETLAKIVRKTDALILKALLASSDSNETLRRASLVFFNSAIDVAIDKNNFFTILPGPCLMKRLVLSSTILCLDSLCRLLVRYKPICQKLKLQRRYKEEVNQLNRYITDVCCALWALKRADPTFLSENLRPDTCMALSDNDVTNFLSITHGACFYSVASEYCKLKGYDSNDQIRGQSKVEYVKYFKYCGWSGIHSFLTTYVEQLSG